MRVVAAGRCWPDVIEATAGDTLASARVDSGGGRVQAIAAAADADSARMLQAVCSVVGVFCGYLVDSVLRKFCVYNDFHGLYGWPSVSQTLGVAKRLIGLATLRFSPDLEAMATNQQRRLEDW